jgi:hypothetical protein
VGRNLAVVNEMLHCHLTKHDQMSRESFAYAIQSSEFPAASDICIGEGVWNYTLSDSPSKTEGFQPWPVNVLEDYVIMPQSSLLSFLPKLFPNVSVRRIRSPRNLIGHFSHTVHPPHVSTASQGRLPKPIPFCGLPCFNSHLWSILPPCLARELVIHNAPGKETLLVFYPTLLSLLSSVARMAIDVDDFAPFESVSAPSVTHLGLLLRFRENFTSLDIRSFIQLFPNVEDLALHIEHFIVHAVCALSPIQRAPRLSLSVSSQHKT